MILYEKAKELKDAGFPQEGNGNWYIVPFDKDGNSDESRVILVKKGEGVSIQQGTQTVYQPTLSELIEACGDQLKAILMPGSIWSKEFGYIAVKEIGTLVSSNIGQIPVPSFWNIYNGKTLEEAVANLYLAINKK